MASGVDGNKKDDKGYIDSAKEKMGEALGKFLDLPERFEDPTTKKVARLGINLLIIAAGFALIYVMNGGISFPSGWTPQFSSLSTVLGKLSDAGVGTLMGLGMGSVIIGVGLGWFVRDLLGEQNRRSAAKVMLLAMILFLAVAGGSAMGHSFHNGITPQSPNVYYMGSLLLIPLIPGAIAYAVKESRKTPVYFHESSARTPHHHLRPIGTDTGVSAHRRHHQHAPRHDDSEVELTIL